MPEPTMTKHRTVMKRETVIFEAVQLGVEFNNYDPDAGPDSTEFLFVTTDTWREFGEPDEITVTIEPGDKLNA